MSHKQELLMKLEEMKLSHTITLRCLLIGMENELTEFQRDEMEDMVKWLDKEQEIYYGRAAEQIGALDESFAEAIIPILISYDNIRNRLLVEMKNSKGPERVDAGIFLAEWICSAPSRFALRLLSLGVDIL